MRWPFAQAITALAEQDPRVVLLMGDVGGGLFSTFRKKFPHRYANLGTAEQSMVGIAAGMALNGLRPIVYSFTPFILDRAFEQVKLDIGHHKAPVLLAGWQDESQGVTHCSPQAEALIRAAGITPLIPKSADEIPSLISPENNAWPAFLLLRPA